MQIMLVVIVQSIKSQTVTTWLPSWVPFLSTSVPNSSFDEARSLSDLADRFDCLQSDRTVLGDAEAVIDFDRVSIKSDLDGFFFIFRLIFQKLQL